MGVNDTGSFPCELVIVKALAECIEPDKANTSAYESEIGANVAKIEDPEYKFSIPVWVHGSWPITLTIVAAPALLKYDLAVYGK